MIGTVEVLAYAPKSIDTIMMDMPVSDVPKTENGISIPMMTMVNPKERSTPNKPNIVFGTSTLHHLVIDGVSQYYSKYAGITGSASRNTIS